MPQSLAWSIGEFVGWNAILLWKLRVRHVTIRAQGANLSAIMVSGNSLLKHGNELLKLFICVAAKANACCDEDQSAGKRHCLSHI